MNIALGAFTFNRVIAKAARAATNIPSGTFQTEINKELRIYSNKFASKSAVVKFSQWMLAGHSNSPMPLKKSARLLTAVKIMDIAGIIQMIDIDSKSVYRLTLANTFLVDILFDILLILIIIPFGFSQAQNNHEKE